MRVLDFIVGMHLPGENVTVRKGYKWANIKIGEKVRLATKGKPNDGKGNKEAIITEISIKPFWKISSSDISHEHDPLCTTKDGLRKSMIQAYPDFSDDDICVLLTYQPV